MVAKHFVEVVYYFYTTSTFNYSFHSFYTVSRELVSRKSILGSVLFMGLGLGLGIHKPIHDQVLPSCWLYSRSHTPYIQLTQSTIRS